MRDILTAIVIGVIIAALSFAAFALVFNLGQRFAYNPDRVSCIPADAVEETPRAVVDAWYSAERCKDLNAEHCGEYK